MTNPNFPTPPAGESDAEDDATNPALEEWPVGVWPADPLTSGRRRALTAAAEQLGRELAADDAPLEPLLRERGYEPYDDDGVVRLRNCPFHAVAQRHPRVVCAMNLALLGGLVEGMPGVSAALEPGPDRCCVALHVSSG